MPSKWKMMKPHTARQLSVWIAAALLGWLWRTYDPESFRPLSQILKYWWVLIPGWIAVIVIEVTLMNWFGQRSAQGKPLEYMNPLEARLNQMEQAINRLHEYVQELDPELAEERRLEEEFMSGRGGMFAGMNHFEYVRDREKAGKRTRHNHNIWRDPDPLPDEPDAL